MEAAEFGRFNIQHRFMQGENAMREAHNFIGPGEYDEWLDGIDKKYASSYIDSYRDVVRVNLIRKERDADAYFLTALDAAALLYLKMKEMAFDRADPEYEFVAYFFAFNIGILEARKYQRLRSKQKKGRAADASRIDARKIEDRFRVDVISFIEDRPSLISKSLAQLVDKLRENKQFQKMHAAALGEAKGIRETTAAAKAKAETVLKERQTKIRVRAGKRIESGDIVVPLVQDPKIPTMEGLYRWLSNLQDIRWIYKVKPKMVQKIPTSR
jgi:hypothetical protein